MDWCRRPAGDPVDPHGVADLLGRAARDMGGRPLAGTRFVFSTRDMLRTSRQIEVAVRDTPGPLYVGFQEAARLDRQHDVYADLCASGTEVVAFGVGAGPASLPAVEWIAVPADDTALVTQWFLVTQVPDPVAFVGFLVAPRHSAPGRPWEGFISRDTRLVDRLASHLEQVRTGADRP